MSTEWWAEYPADGVVVASTELDGEMYAFNDVEVRRSPDGRLWVSTDAGCSCPSPFESHKESDWEELRSIDQLTGYLAGHHDPNERAHFVDEVLKALSAHSPEGDA